MSNTSKKLALLFIIFIYFLTINSWQPLVSDDFLRANINALFNHTIIQNITHDYYNWTGRITAQLPVYVFINKSIPRMIDLLNIINSVAIVYFIVCFFKIITQNKKNILSSDFFIYIVIIIVFAYWTTSIGNIIWKTVAIQYFWGICLIIFLFYRCFVLERFMPLVCILSGIIIGLYNESFFAVTFTISLLYLFNQKLYKKPINKNLFYFIIPLSISAIIMLSAPGSYIRAASLTCGKHGYELISLAMQNMFDIVIVHRALSLIFIASIIITYIKNKDFKYRLLQILYLIIIYLTIIPASIEFTIRCCLIYYVIFEYIILSYIFNNIAILELIKKYQKLLIIIFIFQLLFILFCYYEIHINTQERNKQIMQYHRLNIEHVHFKKIKKLKHLHKLSRVFYIDIRKDENYWLNKTYAQYYDFKSVTTKKVD